MRVSKFFALLLFILMPASLNAGIFYTPVERFGAIGDGLTDDTEAFTKAFSVSDKVSLKKSKKYLIKGTVYFNKDNVTLKGNGASVIFTPSPNYKTGFRVRDHKDIVIKGVSFSSKLSYPTAGGFKRVDGSLWSNVICIMASGVQTFSVKSCEFSNLEYAVKIDSGSSENRKITISGLKTTDMAMSVFIAYCDGAVIEDCDFSASENGCSLDHQIYGEAGNTNHIIRKVVFRGGNGVPVHYYTPADKGARNIVVENCTFYETSGACLVSSSGYADMSISNTIVESNKNTKSVVFSASELALMTITGGCVKTPYLPLINTPGSSKVFGLNSDTSYLFTSLPKRGQATIFKGCHITTRLSSPIIYIGESYGSTGSVLLEGNTICLNDKVEYLMSFRNPNSESIIINGNTIECKGGSKYIVYNSGNNTPWVSVLNNKIQGCESEKHFSVSGVKFEHNELE